ncbi:MAG: tRNA (N(6)-L-threonylcarbamoyladenosine(37)-C(2))-methylthiotransferase MtaB [Oscillospiraceae bacterium]
MRAAFFTLGCKVNQYETSVLIEHFARDGFEIVPHEDEADVYILNSCTVTAGSDRKGRQMLRRFRRQNPSAVVALVGCFPQAFPDAAERLPEADILMGARGRGRLLAAVKARLAGGDRIVDITPHEKGEEFEEMKLSAFAAHTRAFVKIQDGCERRCAYCIIPTARGPVRSKPLPQIAEELEALAAAGHREAVLVGINLSSYGRDTGRRLLSAVETACGVKVIDRVRLGSLEPELLSGEDIHRMAAQPKFCPQFHLSLQSGCDATLRRMRRPYDTAEYSRIVAELRAAFPNCAITTDIMVGFPGETEEEFQESVDFAAKIGLARAHVFAYSRRPGTAAADMPDQIPEQEKAARSRKMIEATNETRRAFLESQVGRTVQVLFETPTADGRWEGYSENYTPVRVIAQESPEGKILPVAITSVEEDGEGCSGVVVGV